MADSAGRASTTVPAGCADRLCRQAAEQCDGKDTVSDTLLVLHKAGVMLGLPWPRRWEAPRLLSHSWGESELAQAAAFFSGPGQVTHWDGWVRGKATGTVWQKRTPRLGPVPGLPRRLDKNGSLLTLQPLLMHSCFLLVRFQLVADSWLKGVVDYQTGIQTGKLKDFGLSLSYLGQDPSTNVNSQSPGGNPCHTSFLCELLLLESQLSSLSSGLKI